MHFTNLLAGLILSTSSAMAASPAAAYPLQVLTNIVSALSTLNLHIPLHSATSEQIIQDFGQVQGQMNNLTVWISGGLNTFTPWPQADQVQYAQSVKSVSYLFTMTSVLIDQQKAKIPKKGEGITYTGIINSLVNNLVLQQAILPAAPSKADVVTGAASDAVEALIPLNVQFYLKDHGLA